MLLKDIKKVVKTLGHAVLLEEDGSGLVVIPLDKYLQLTEPGKGEEVAVRRAKEAGRNGYGEEEEENWRVTVSPRVNSEQDLLLVEKLNQDIAMLKEEIKRRELEELEDGLEGKKVDRVD